MSERAAAFEIEPIGPTIGAEIHGLDLTRTLDAETYRALEAALNAHKAIYLRDQNLTTAQHVALGRMFGELEVHPFRPEGEFPEIMVLDNHKDNPVLSTDVWHSDTTFRECPTKYSILRCLEIPRAGGDTLWADMCAAYDG
ncbi:MAG: TauD/TfdA dioxygenase family protein, partial [Alphaproteobacteria bacterium]